MAPFLSRYPDRPTSQLLQVGFTEAFLTPCSLSQIPPVADSLRSVLLHSKVASEKLAKEVLLGRMCGPFPNPLWTTCAVSYTSFDAGVFWAQHYGKGALMAKTDRVGLSLVAGTPAQFSPVQL